jgi:hypothetical protein
LIKRNQVRGIDIHFILVLGSSDFVEDVQESKQCPIELGGDWMFIRILVTVGL